MSIVSSFRGILLSLLPMFTAPSGELFLRLVVGWVVCPMRRTLTGIFPYADPEGKRKHDAYHRFFREGAWWPVFLFHAWAKVVAGSLCPPGPLWLIGDDTVHKKTGRKVEGAAFRRDAVRSTGSKTVFVWGLQIVLLCVRVLPPWGGEPLAIPIGLRLYRKGGPSVLDLMAAMIQDVATWFPERPIYFSGDGFYAALAGRLPTRVHILSRMRYDAALYDLPAPRRAGHRGRPRKKGNRLGTPRKLAQTVRHWETVQTQERGKTRTRLVYTRRVLWYGVRPHQPVLLVLSRDPAGIERDDFFFTTDLSLSPAQVISEFANRWPIEDTFRSTKQFLGAQEPQSWKGEGPEKVAAFAYLLYGAVWLWYVRHAHGKTPLRSTPWYRDKKTPSFIDALACLRKALWRERFFQTVGSGAHMNKFQALLVEALAYAA